MANNKICSRCGSDDIQFQTVAEQHKRGCLTILLYVILACSIIGLPVLVIILGRQKTETITYCVCQNCGKRWKA